MSGAQKFMKAVLPKSWAEDMEAESRQWVMQCSSGRIACRKLIYSTALPINKLLNSNQIRLIPQNVILDGIRPKEIGVASA